MVIFDCKLCPFSGEYPDDAPFKCPKCESKNYTLTYLKGHRVKGEFCNIDGTMREHERWSDALGVNPDQIPAFKEKFGSLMEFDNEGRCKVKHRKHKKELMKARGYEELD